MVLIERVRVGGRLFNEPLDKLVKKVSTDFHLLKDEDN